MRGAHGKCHQRGAQGPGHMRLCAQWSGLCLCAEFAGWRGCGRVFIRLGRGLMQAVKSHSGCYVEYGPQQGEDEGRMVH